MYHTVKQGEHLSRITAAYGFADNQTIWNLPENADLKTKRKNPNVLFPGDKLYVPVKEQKTLEKPTDQKHTFIRHLSSLKLRLKLSASRDELLANSFCQLIIEAHQTNLKTDEQAQLQKTIEKTTERAVLIVEYQLRRKKDRQTMLLEIPLLIGHLDPVEEVSGQRARLLNLGYYRGPNEIHNKIEFASAVEEFQCDQKLPVDGVCGAQTQARLVEVHGC